MPSLRFVGKIFKGLIDTPASNKFIRNFLAFFAKILPLPMLTFVHSGKVLG
jgi:hypothetical protein